MIGRAGPAARARRALRAGVLRDARRRSSSRCVPRGPRSRRSGRGMPICGARSSACATLVAPSSPIRFRLVAAGQLREPGAEPAGVRGLVHAQQQPGRTRAHQLDRRRRAVHRGSPRAAPPGAPRPAGVRHAALVHRRALDALHLDPVAVAVGEAPGDVPVGAGHQQRRRRAASRRSGRASRRRVVEPRVVPDGRHALRRGACRWRRGPRRWTSVARPTAQLLLPITGALARRLPAPAAPAAALRRSSALGGGTGARARRRLGCRDVGGIPVGARPDTGTAARTSSPRRTSGPPRRASTSRRRISRRKSFACRSHHIA